MEEGKKEGFLSGIMEVFKEKLKELSLEKATIAFLAFLIIMAFTVTGFVVVISAGVINIIKIVPLMVQSVPAG